MTEPIWLPLVVLVPLLCAVAAFVVSERIARWATLPAAAAVSALVVGVMLQDDAARHYALGAWPIPVGIPLSADTSSLALLTLIAAVYLAVLSYARAYFAHDSRKAKYFWPLAWLLWGTLNAAVVSADLFNLYVTLELLTFTAVGLAALGATPAALTASIRYLLAALLASNLFLLAIAVLYGSTGVLALTAIAERVRPDTSGLLAVALIVAALTLKTALAPLHAWLPPAHAGAVTPVSALLSALVIKASWFILLRIWLLLAPRLDLATAGQLLAACGAVAILWGSVAALRQRRIKLLVAYSTVAQTGYAFLVFGWLTPGSPAAPLALEAAVMQIVAHGIAKAAMFLAAGTLVLAAGRDDLEALRGAASRQPVAMFAFSLAGASLIGLPPSAGFAAKWQLLRAAAVAGDWWIVAVIIAGGLLAAAYVFRVLRLSFLPDVAGSDARPVAGALCIVPLALALVASLGGLVAAPALGALNLSALTEALR